VVSGFHLLLDNFKFPERSLAAVSTMIKDTIAITTKAP
jgi:hypothetical protein